MRNRSKSHTISNGGFSRATEYCCNCTYAACRSLCLPLYSQLKQPRFQTSAQPSPPLSLDAPRSKQYHSPSGSAVAGVGSSSRLHRSRKCSWAADRSLRFAAFHFLINSTGVIGAVCLPLYEGNRCIALLPGREHGSG